MPCSRSNRSWLIGSLISASNTTSTCPGADFRLSKVTFWPVLCFGTRTPHALATYLLQLEDGVISKHLESWAISATKTEQSHSPAKIAVELLLFQYSAWWYLDLTCNCLFYSAVLWKNMCVGGKKFYRCCRNSYWWQQRQKLDLRWWRSMVLSA